MGDEPDEYVNQAENNTIISFNTVCNLDPTILAYFYADAGRKFGRTEDGWEEEFRKEEGWVNKAGALPAPQNQMIHGESKTPAFLKTERGKVEKFSEIYIKVNYC